MGKAGKIALILLGMALVLFFLLLLRVSNEPMGFTMGEEGRIIEHCDDGIICRQYNLISQPVCFRDKDLVRKYCE